MESRYIEQTGTTLITRISCCIPLKRCISVSKLTNPSSYKTDKGWLQNKSNGWKSVSRLIRRDQDLERLLPISLTCGQWRA